MQFKAKNDGQYTSRTGLMLNKKAPADLQTLKSLPGKKKLQYIWDYYKLPLALICILLYVIIYVSYRHFTYKEPVLYTALVNVNAGETLTAQLDQGFLDAAGINASQNRLYLYSGLFLTDDESSSYHEYTYASRMKILAAIDGEQLDVVLMDKEAFDAFSQNGYLYRIDELLQEEAPDLYEELQPFIVENTFIAEDNSFEMQFDDSVTYSAVTEEYPMGLELSQAELIRQAGFEDTVYFGIVANSPRIDTALDYLQYLFCGR